MGYYSSQSRLDVLVDQIGDDEAIQLARNLSREYTATGGWATVDSALSEAGYIYDGAREGEGEGHGEGEREGSESFHRDQIRVVIAGIDGRVVRDNLSDVPPGTTASNLEGRRETVFDLSTNQPVGHVYVDVNREFLSTESRGFLNTLLLDHFDRWNPDRWCSHTPRRSTFQTHHDTCNGADRGDAGDRARGYDPPASDILGRSRPYE